MSTATIDLSGSPFEQDRIKKYRDKKLNAAKRMWIADGVLQGRFTALEIAKRLEISRATVNAWVSKRRAGHIFMDCSGRPTLLDLTAQQAVVSTIKSRKKADKAMIRSELRGVLTNAIKDTRQRRDVGENVAAISTRSLYRYKKNLTIKATKGQKKTHARAAAEFDPRNSFAEACMIEAFQTGISPHLILNMDATQYFSVNGKDSVDDALYIVDKSDKLPVSKSGPDDDEMGMFIKSYNLASASGCLGPMVLLFADATMDATDIRVIPCAGVSNSPDLDKSGFIVFTKTRVGNAAFYSWYLKSIICPYVDKTRATFQLTNMKSFVSTDGEQIQIETFSTPENLELLSTSDIIAAKHAASYSGRGNALDAGNLFKATKKRLLHLPQDQLQLTMTCIAKTLKYVLNPFVAGLGTAVLQKIIIAICRIVAACRATCTAPIVSHGFAKTGQYLAHKEGLDFDTKMSCCTRPLSKAEMATMKTNFATMVKRFREKGYITEAEMDEAKIVKVVDKTRKKPKDARVLHQNRSLIINTIQNISRFKELQEAKLKKAPAPRATPSEMDASAAAPPVAKRGRKRKSADT